MAYEECRKQAQNLGTKVTGSELVGLLPKECLLMSGTFYAEKIGLKTSDEKELIRCAVEQLGLSQLATFEPDKKIIDYMI
jgi:glutamate formiminotransferase / formiminotetrahydrofolate cyclodeaminase